MQEVMLKCSCSEILLMNVDFLILVLSAPSGNTLQMDTIRERLDRGLATNVWLTRFASTRVHHLTLDSSDHYPLWIVPECLEIPNSTKPFKFEEMWLSYWGCMDVVEAVQSFQEVSDPTVKVIQKIVKCGKELRKRNWEHFEMLKGSQKEKKN